jgi:hypothetical protein
MARPDAGWLERLPKDRLIAEFSVWSAGLVRLADDMTRIAPCSDILHIDVANGVLRRPSCSFLIWWQRRGRFPPRRSMRI